MGTAWQTAHSQLVMALDVVPSDDGRSGSAGAAEALGVAEALVDDARTDESPPVAPALSQGFGGEGMFV